MESNITIISARWVIPVEPRNTVLEAHSVVFESGKIIDIDATDLVLEKYPGANIVNRPEHALIPGLINAHTHAAMCLFRGLADDLPLMDWLNQHIWPAETKWVDPAFIRDGTELAIAEMLYGGTTCFSDMYFYPDIVAKITQDSGIRAVVGMIVMDFPTAWASHPEEYFSKGLQVHDEVRSLSRVNTAMAPHAPYSVSDEPLITALTYADELKIPMHMHIHETEQEVADALKHSKMRPIKRLNQLGLLNPQMIAVHMTQLNDDEIELLARQGVHVAHCPNSNAKLASGVCRVADLLHAGVNVCLGTDSAASNNSLDMFAEMRAAALNAKSFTANASSLPAWQVLEMATINGAKAINQQAEIGSLVVGKAADIVAVNLNHISTQPVYHPISQLVYSASREQVEDVWVDGKHLVNNKNLTNIDLDQLLSKTASWGDKIRFNKPLDAANNKDEQIEH